MMLARERRAGAKQQRIRFAGVVPSGNQPSASAITWASPARFGSASTPLAFSLELRSFGG